MEKPPERVDFKKKYVTAAIGAIAGQRSGLTVEVTVRTGVRIKTPLFTIETKSVFDGKSLLCKACFSE